MESKADALVRWRSWIGRVTSDLLGTRLRVQCWWEAAQCWNTNHALRLINSVTPWIQRAHTDSLVLAIRRETDRDPKSVSLWRLLSDLERRARHVTIADHLELVTSADTELRAEMAGAARAWVEPGTEHLDPCFPAQDLEELERDSALVRKYANREVAHRDKERGPIVTYGDLDDAVVRIERITDRYNKILRAATYLTYLPHHHPNHELFLRRAWRRPRWKRTPWPQGMAERVAEFSESFDLLSAADVGALFRARHRLRSEFASRWQSHAPIASPVRTVLEALGLPSSDAAVMWVRDRLLMQDV